MAKKKKQTEAKAKSKSKNKSEGSTVLVDLSPLPKPLKKKRNVSKHKGWKGDNVSEQVKAALAKTGIEGACKSSHEEYQAKMIDKSLINRIITLNAHKSVRELEGILAKQEITTLEHIVIAGLLRAAHTGDYNAINFWFDRLIGKVPTKYEVKSISKYENMSVEELLEEKEKLQADNQRSLEYIMMRRGLDTRKIKDINMTPQAEANVNTLTVTAEINTNEQAGSGQHRLTTTVD